MNTLELLQASALTALVSATCHAQAPAAAPAAPPAGIAPAQLPPVHPDNLPPAPHLDNGETLWPQEAREGTSLYVLFTPQFESITGRDATARAAFSVTPAGSTAMYGTVRITAAVENDSGAGLVELRDLKVGEVRRVDGKDAGDLPATLARMLAGMHFTVQRSVALANMEADAAQAATGAKLANPVPAIKVVDHAATALLLDGPPVMRLVAPGVGIAQNTPSLLAFDAGGSRWLTRIGADRWLAAPRYAGPYSPCQVPPDAVRTAIDAALPARHPEAGAPVGSSPKSTPEVIVSTVPLCLVSIDGSPDLAQVADGLFAVRNANCDLFTASGSGAWWLLSGGRWFSTMDLMNGPWSYSSASALPASFRQIDPRGTWGNVLASVPGTEAAKDALYQQGILHTATLDRFRAKATVRSVGGAPEFKPVPGTKVALATNTNVPVLSCAGAFYACQDGAWFKGASATGPWQLCDSLPADLATLPPSCPAYGTTFVRVENSTPQTVTFSYSAGYMNSFTSDGTVVWGTGSDSPGNSFAAGNGPDTPDTDVVWGEYLGWPNTYGLWPSFGYAGWTCAAYPGWTEHDLQCAPGWGAAGWWGPGSSFGIDYALGMNYGGAWHWGYHPWGSQAGNDWWAYHWGGAYSRGWSTAAVAGNRAAGGGSTDSVATRWGHAGGLTDDVSASPDGKVMQQRGGHTYARGAAGWQRADDATPVARPASAATATSGGFREADGSAAAASAARANSSMDDFRPDPNHNFNGSPRGSFARGETNYADRKEGLEPASHGDAPKPMSRGGSWNGGGWDRPDQRGQGQASAPADGGRAGAPPQHPNAGWSNGQRSYGEGSGYTGARGVVRSSYTSQSDGYAQFEGGGGLSSGYSGGIGAPVTTPGLSSGYASQRNGPGLSSGYTGGLGVQNAAPGLTSGYTGGGGGVNTSMWGYGMIGGANPQYTWMGAWPGYGMYGGYYGGYGGYYGGYRGYYPGGMRTGQMRGVGGAAGGRGFGGGGGRR